MVMKKSFLCIMIILLFVQQGTLSVELDIASPLPRYDWAIVGAGLAGITALAILLDSGVEPSTIAWIDPEFNVGRVGKSYRNVPGNIAVERIILFVQNCPYFKDINSPSLEQLYTYNPAEFPPLSVVADPLQDFTAYLRNKVVSLHNTITSLTYNDDHWALKGADCAINAHKVILAIGAKPKRLNYAIEEIPLDDALDKNKLATCVSADDRVAVFGGMHSAILILKYLSEMSVKQIINFYIDPYFYDAPGLEGETALWAQTVLEQAPPANLIRVLSIPENTKTMLSTCNKAIYAIGYETNPILVNEVLPVTFDESTGMIDHNLYGIGIAFPPTGIVNGQKIAKNGLHAYLGYAKKLIPHWISNERFYPNNGIKPAHYELPWI